MIGGQRWVERAVGRFRWSTFATGPALRGVAGVVAPLVAGTATGHVEDGVFVSIGSMSAGFAAFQGVHRTKVTAVVLAGLGMAVASFVGATTTHWAAAAVPAALMWGYLAGLVVVLGPRAAVVGLQWGVAFVIATEIPMPVEGALVRSCLVLGGSLWEAVLVIVAWPLRPGSAERAALGASFAGLASYASGAAREGAGVPGPSELPTASAVLGDANPFLPGSRRLALRHLLDEAERVRISLAALASISGRAPGPGGASEPGSPAPTQPAPGEGSAASSASVALETAGVVLGGVAQALASSPSARTQAETTLSGALAAARSEPEGSGANGTLPLAAELLAQLHGIVRALPRVDGGQGAWRPPTWWPSPAQATPGRLSALRESVLARLRTLWGAVGTGSEAGRHALRLGLAVGGAEAISRVFPLGHGYWAPMTVLIVLKPDYSTTVGRGVQRVVGTALGALVAVGIAVLLPRGDVVLLGSVAVLTFVAYATFPVNYLLFAVCLTDLVLFLLDLVGFALRPTGLARVEDTLIGGALALAAYLSWPTWGGGGVAERLAAVLDAQRRYLHALLHRAPEVAALLVEARVARSDAEAAVQRLLEEPAQIAPIAARAGTGHRAQRGRDRPGVSRDLAVGVVASLQLSAQSLLGVHAALDVMWRAGPAAVPERWSEELESVAAGLDASMRALAASLRAQQPPVAPAALARRRLDRLGASASGTPALVAAELEMLADALETLGFLLSSRLGEPAWQD